MPKDVEQTDHDLLVELRTEMRGVRRDIQTLQDNTASRIADHEIRIRSLEDIEQRSKGRIGAFSWAGSLFNVFISLLVAIISALIISGKLPI